MSKYIFFAVCVLSGCSSIPKDAFLLAPSTQADKRLESRIFSTNDELALLKDSAVILENMGYKTVLMNSELGLITATKQENNAGITTLIMSILSVGLASTDKEQVFRATFTTRPATGKSNAFITRLTLQRMVMNADGEASSVELLKDEDLYKMFYQRLEASTFIEPDAYD
jgi:hypothetical protein